MGQLVFQAALGGAVNLIGPNISATTNFTLPGADGTNGQALTTNGSGVLGFSSIVSGAAGSNTQVQFNSGGNFGASASLTWDGTNLTSTGFSGPHNGTVGATTANTGNFTTLTTSSTVTLNGGTANGVTYLNGSKVLTSGSALTFSGTSLGINTASSSDPLNVKVNGVDVKFVVQDGFTSGNLRLTAVDAAYTTYKNLEFSAASTLFYSSGSEQMRLTSTGLGIGTSSPSYKLDVAGAARSDSWIGRSNTSAPTADAFIYRPADNTISLGTANTERLRLDSAGNLGLGVTPSAWVLGSRGAAFEIQDTASSFIGVAGISGLGTELIRNAYYGASGWTYKAAGAATRFVQSGGTFQFHQAASGTAGTAISFTQAMTLDASGNLLLGGTSATGDRLTAYVSPTASGQQGYRLTDGTKTCTWWLTGASYNYAGVGANEFWLYANSNINIGPDTATGVVKITTNAAERARIDSSGNLLVGRTSAIASERLSVEGSNTSFISRIRNTSATTPSGVFVSYTAAAPNDTGNSFFRADDNAATRAEIRSNGGIANYSANNVNLSDVRTKTDIQNAGGYLAKICAIPVRTFKYKDQTDDLLNLGVIAQEVEAVAPELVDVSGFGETPEDGVPLKAIYQTDLQYALMKALQELKAEFDAYKASHP